MIKPAVGRIVHYYPDKTSAGEDSGLAKNGMEPLAAIICAVWGDRCVSLVVFNAYGVPHGRTSVQLLQDDDHPLALGRYCQWMPFQKEQAAKTEEVERDLALKNHGIETH